MAIKLYNDRIEIISGPKTFTLKENRAIKGISFDGRMKALYLEGAPPPTYQGTVSGYISGGLTQPTPTQNIIDKFPFATNTNASDVGDLTTIRYGSSGHSSDVSGYTAGGLPMQNTIDKFPFASNANATDVGDMTFTTHVHTGQQSSTHGYNSGGVQPPSTWYNNIDKFPFSINANATDVGDMVQARYGNSGQSSSIYGYNSGGLVPSPTGVVVGTIDVFPFASDGNAAFVGNLSVVAYHTFGQSSTTHGYTSGGVWVNTIDRFPFSAISNATDVGDLTQSRLGTAGQSSTTHGHSSGGGLAPTQPRGQGVFSSNVIDRFPFATNANATDVGDLTVQRAYQAGQQD